MNRCATFQVRDPQFFLQLSVNLPKKTYHPVGTPIFIPDGVPYEYLFISTGRTGSGLAFIQLPEPCYSAAFEIACTSKLRPCMQIDNGKFNNFYPYRALFLFKPIPKNRSQLTFRIVTLPYPRQSCRDVCTSYRKLFCTMLKFIYFPSVAACSTLLAQLNTALTTCIGPQERFVTNFFAINGFVPNSCVGCKFHRLYGGRHYLQRD